MFENVKALLRGSVAQRINFRFRGVRVYGAGYAQIAEKIDAGDIKIRLSESQSMASMLQRHGGSVYNHVENTLYVPDVAFLELNDSFDKALVIHEMTHALADLQGNHMTKLKSESVAYIAQAFALMVGGMHRNHLARAVSPFREVLEAAWPIAESVYRTRGGYGIDENSASDALETAIQNIGVYANAVNETVDYNQF